MNKTNRIRVWGAWEMGHTPEEISERLGLPLGQVYDVILREVYDFGGWEMVTGDPRLSDWLRAARAKALRLPRNASAVAAGVGVPVSVAKALVSELRERYPRRVRRRGPSIRESVRTAIIESYLIGNPVWHIATETGLPITTVRQVIRRWKKEATCPN